MDSSEKIQTQCSSSALRVLLVDDDLLMLQSLEDNLKTWGYHVITCTSTRGALHLINEKKHGVDVVLCELNMASTEFLNHTSVEVPVTGTYNMQEDTSEKLILRVLGQRECWYVLKSEIAQWLRFHEQADVFKRRSKEAVNDVENNHQAAAEETQMMIESDEAEKSIDDDPNMSNPRKKQRFFWTHEFHEKFKEEVNKVGLEKAKPSKILEAMNVPGLTRDRVSSHLQRYRIRMERAQKAKHDHDHHVLQQKLAMNNEDAAAPHQEPANHETDGIINMQRHNIYAAVQGQVTRNESSAPQEPVKDDANKDELGRI